MTVSGERAGRYTAIMPALSPSLAAGFKELQEMNEYTLLPAYIDGPDFEALKNALKVLQLAHRSACAPYRSN
jgi:hypothetical protein